MEDPVHIAIVMERSDVDKLALLADGDAQPSEYLTRLVRLLHDEQERHGHTLNPETLVHDVHLLVEQRNQLETKVLSLTQRMNELVAEYTKLLARVQTLSYSLAQRGSRLLH